MKKLLLILLCVPLMFSCGQENETMEKKIRKVNFILDSKTPANVVNAIFYAARTQNFEILGELCDPKGEGDDDTKAICKLAFSETSRNSRNSKNRKEFIDYFKNGKIRKSTYGNLENGEAKVPIFFGPKGDLKETIRLIKREDKWYLVNY